MLNLSRPQSIDASIEQMYQYLIGRLEPLAGYPLRLERGARGLSPAHPTREPDGSIHYPLPAAKGRAAHWRLVAPPDGARDRQCTRIVTRFMTMCIRIAKEIRQVPDIKDILVRNGDFLWDDLILSLSHTGGQKFSAVELITALRSSLLFRYEEKPARLGVLMTWNWHSTGQVLAQAGCRVLSAKKPEDIEHALRESKALNWLADGVNSLLLVNPKGKITGWFSISALRNIEPMPDWSMVPRRYHHLHTLLVGRDVICTTTQTGELYLFRKTSVMKWTHEGWRRVSGIGIDSALSRHLPEEAAAVLTDVAVEMSLRKRGGLIAVVPDPAEISSGASAGVGAYFREDPLLQITRADYPLILRMATLDGCLIVDTSGAVRNAGVILKISDAHTGAGEGARSAAASYASTHGLAIQISQDGPLSVYENGVLTRFA